MKTHIYRSKCILTCLLIFCISSLALAQTPFTGPSDASTAAPATASDPGLSAVLCTGSEIKLTGPQDASNVDYTTYQWYKINSSGTQVLVKSGADKTYTETADGTGYYNYKLIVINSNGCASELSDLYKLFVLPQLIPSITASSDNICAQEQSSSTLTASVTPTGYTYNYQWTRDGNSITGATNSTYVVTEQNAGSISFGVNVSFALNSSCTQTTSKTITVIAVPGKPSILIGN